MRSCSRAVFAFLLALAVGVLVLPGKAKATLSPPDTSHPGYVEFSNSMGTWRIYTSCGSGAGPGYIAWGTHGGRVVIDDTSAGQQDSDGTTGIRVPQGLGKFIYREARAQYKAPLTFSATNSGNTYYVDGRHCAGSGGGYGTADPATDTGVNPDPAYTHQIGGVVPGTDAHGAYYELRYMVTFKDRYIPNFLSVTYVWRFYDDHIGMWSDVIERCSGPTLTTNSKGQFDSNSTVIVDGECSYNPNGANYPHAWIKGPKYTVGIGSWTQANGFPGQLPYSVIRTTGTSSATTLCSYQRTGVMWQRPGDALSDVGIGWACPTTSSVGTCSSTATYCWPTNPTQTARPDPRAWVQFESAANACSPDCFNAVFRAYPPDGNGTYYPPSYGNNEAGITPGQAPVNWVSMGNFVGVDQWAQNEDLEAPQNFTNCSGTQSSPGDYAGKSRLWETVGDKYSSSAPVFQGNNANNWTTKSDPYTFAGNYFFAWRDCINVQDDPLIYRAQEGYDTNYGTYATFAYTTSASTQPPGTNG
jgi:hypothetical protein